MQRFEDAFTDLPAQLLARGSGCKNQIVNRNVPPGLRAMAGETQEWP